MFNFSLLHTSARPEKWREIYDEWLELADQPHMVQYILVGDTRWGFHKYNPGLSLRDQDTYLLLDPQRKCYVEGVNLAARYARGCTLVVNADDQHPCQGWDTHLTRTITELGVTHGEYVLRVPTGTPDEIKRNITVMPVLSRSRYHRLGYVLYPGYESMYADNDFTEHAQLDGVFHEVNSPVFEHRHPFWTGMEMDDQYREQNRQEAYNWGANLLNLRRALGFAQVKPQGQTQTPQAQPAKRETVAVCLPGETFSSTWLSAWTELFVYLFTQYNVIPIFCHVSNVHITRGVLCEQIRQIVKGDGTNPPPDYVLWIDDDNPVKPQHFANLLEGLKTVSEADGITGWCWIHDQLNARYLTSCGSMDQHGMCTHYTESDLVDSDFDLLPIEFTGFPLFLMRASALDDRLGKHPFAPIIQPGHMYGAMSEDTAYCYRAREQGLRFYVDRRVKVDHLKTCPTGPPSVYQGVKQKVLPAAETLTR